MLPLTLTRPLTFIDLETTSKFKALARIVELAIVQFKPWAEDVPEAERTGPFQVVEWWSLVNPGVLIPAEATAKHNIRDEDVLTAPRFETLAPKLIRAFQGCDIGRFNIRYDFDVTMHEFERCGVSTQVPEGVTPPRLVDAYRLWQVTHPRTLTDYIREMLGEDHTNAHGAEADIKGTIRALAKHFELHPELPTELDALHELQFSRDPNAVDRDGKILWWTKDGVTFAGLSFGKHVEKPLARVPKDYLDYLLRGDLPHDARAILTEARAGRFPIWVPPTETTTPPPDGMV